MAPRVWRARLVGPATRSGLLTRLSRVSGEAPEPLIPPADPAVLVILPTYNEADTLAEVVMRALTAVPHANLLIIDDASNDGTGAIAEVLARQDPRVTTLHRPGKLGLGTAYVTGFAHACERGYRWVVEMDADGSHLPEELPELLREAQRGAGLVIGARWVPGGRIEGWSRHRRWVSRTGTRIARVALKSRLHDATSGYRVIDTRWLGRIELGRITAQGYGFQIETAWILERHGCPVTETPITFVERRAGRSKMTLGIAIEALRLIVRWGWHLRTAPDRLPVLRAVPARSTREATPPTAR